MIRFEKVSVTFTEVAALRDIDLDVPTGALCVLVGPSGSGKSTLMRLVNRLITPSKGRVLVRGEDVAEVDATALRRSIGYVIQSIGLFPHRTVAQNIATVPQLLGWPRDRIAARVAEMLDLVRLGEDAVADRYPAELSGGQAQRVGLARALAAEPDILLMDEPFGAVDPIVRRDLRLELKRIHAHTGKTILLVTHDPIEALDLATQIAVLRDGALVAEGPPAALLAQDGDPFVRHLFGGEDLGLRRLRFMSVASALDPAPAGEAPAIEATASLREALARMIDLQVDRLAVVGEDGVPLGSVPLDAVVREPARGGMP